MNHHHDSWEDATSIYDLDHAPAPPSSTSPMMMNRVVVVLPPGDIPPPPPRSSSSLSPRPPGRNSVVLPPSLPPAPPDHHLTRRRLSSYSSTSIPTVGGSYTYGGGGDHPTTNRQRSYSSSAVAATFSSSIAFTSPPPHLAHVRSFPPPVHCNVSRSLTDRPPSNLYSPTPLIRRIVEETKEPVEEDHNGHGDRMEPTTDSGYESELFHDGTDRMDSVNDNNDRLMMMGGTNVELPNVSSIPPSLLESPTLLYHQDSSGTRNHYDEESVSQTHHDTLVMLLCGCIPLPRLFAKRRISWDRKCLFRDRGTDLASIHSLNGRNSNVGSFADWRFQVWHHLLLFGHRALSVSEWNIVPTVQSYFV